MGEILPFFLMLWKSEFFSLCSLDKHVKERGEGKRSEVDFNLGFPGDSVVKNPPALQET